MQTLLARFGANAPALPALHLAAPLPRLSDALARRANITFAASTSPDVWLFELGEDMAAADRTVDAIVSANPTGFDTDPAWECVVARFRALFREMERMPAITADGLYAKAKALKIPWVAESKGLTARLSASLAADVRHLFSGEGRG